MIRTTLLNVKTPTRFYHCGPIGLSNRTGGQDQPTLRMWPYQWQKSTGTFTRSTQYCQSNGPSNSSTAAAWLKKEGEPIWEYQYNDYYTNLPINLVITNMPRWRGHSRSTICGRHLLTRQTKCEFKEDYQWKINPIDTTPQRTHLYLARTPNLLLEAAKTALTLPPNHNDKGIY